MSALEELRPNAAIRGILPDSILYSLNKPINPMTSSWPSWNSSPTTPTASITSAAPSGASPISG